MLRALACSVLFLTRIPLPRLTLDASDFARSSGFFAWVGALIALLLWGASLLFVPALGARLAALSLIALWVAITGGLHLDGLADLTDGLSGGRGERARTLEIMRDSRIGAHGAVALALVLMLKWAALERALELGALGWTIAPVVGRFAATLCIASFPYAREAGLGSPFVGSAKAPALALGLLPLALVVYLLGPATLVPAALGLACALLLALRCQRLLSGLTGDVYGAAIELAELAVLLSVTALR
jgi:adenosylcobinamide-GDP ribazoletransferase